MNHKIRHNGTVWTVNQVSGKQLNRTAGYPANSSKFLQGDTVIDVDDSDFAAIQAKYGHLMTEAKSTDGATDAQMRYLQNLGVDVGNAKLSKRQASSVIDSVKSGNGVGQFGLTFFDGSN